MSDYIAIMMAHQRTADGARQALPDATVQLEPDGGPASAIALATAPRGRVSLAPRRLADRLEPAPANSSRSSQAGRA